MLNNKSKFRRDYFFSPLRFKIIGIKLEIYQNEMMICRLKIASVFVILATSRTTSGPQNTALLVLKWELHCVV